MNNAFNIYLFYVSGNAMFALTLKASSKKEGKMEMHTAYSPFRSHGIAPDVSNSPSMFQMRPAMRAMVNVVNTIFEKCRLVRAYNELARLGDHSLREIGNRPGELNRILSGHPSRPTRRRVIPD